MPTSPLTVRSGSAGPICRLHQPAATQSGPRPTRRINAHILNWVRERERGLSLWDLAQPTCHIPSHNAALSTTAQQPWQGAEKKSWRRTDAILVLLTLMRPPKRPLYYIRAFSIYFCSSCFCVHRLWGVCDERHGCWMASEYQISCWWHCM